MSIKRLFSSFLHAHHSHFAASLAVLLLSGCGGSSTETASLEPENQGNRPVASSDVKKAESPRPLLTAPELQTPEPPDQPRVFDAAAVQRAEQLFDRLVAPGIGLDEWDQAQQALLNEGEAAAHVLARKLARGTELEREMAATTLALLGSQSAPATQQLHDALHDPSPFVRANAAAALVQLPDQTAAAVPALIDLLKADDPQLRQLAAVNLNAAGQATAPHLESLFQALNHDDSQEVLTPVVELLGRLGRPAKPALPLLQKISFEKSGELKMAAENAIQFITAEPVSP